MKIFDSILAIAVITNKMTGSLLVRKLGEQWVPPYAMLHGCQEPEVIKKLLQTLGGNMTIEHMEAVCVEMDNTSQFCSLRMIYKVKAFGPKILEIPEHLRSVYKIQSWIYPGTLLGSRKMEMPAARLLSRNISLIKDA